MPAPLAGGRAPLGLALALALLPAACRTAPARERALEARAFAPISYEAEIANHAVRLAELSDLDAEPCERVEARADDVLIDVNARFVSTTAAAAEAALGWSPQERSAAVVERAAGSARLDALVAEGGARELGAPRLSLVAGHGGFISVSNQVAYLERFELVAYGRDCVADPAVGVAEEGFLLKAHPEAPSAAGTVPLQLELVVASLEQPMRERTVALPGSGALVSLQSPLSTSQKLATELELGPDDLLILGGLPAREPGEYLFLFLTCDVLGPGDGAR